jgi:hypothetical protein
VKKAFSKQRMFWESFFALFSKKPEGGGFPVFILHNTWGCVKISTNKTALS